MAPPRPTWCFPNCGCLLQARLGCRGAPAFSLEAACSGFIYALAMADKFVRAGEARRALVVGSEVLSRITDHSDRSTAILFGDGAGAVVLAPSEEPGIISTHLHADGSYEPPALLHRRSGARARTRHHGRGRYDPHGRQRGVQAGGNTARPHRR